jgi:hypothetical protein
MIYILKKDYTTASGRVLKAGTSIDVHKSDVDKIKPYLFDFGKIEDDSENAIDKQPKKETRKK